MGRLIISENVSLDGVGQDPTGEEGFRFGGWFGQVGEADRAEWGKLELAEALAAEALLLGRRSYDFFAQRWPSRSGEWADRLNSMPKYVVSSTLEDPKWQNTTVLRGDALDAVGRLKRELAGDIVLYASLQLARTLLVHDLADELRLVVYPSVLGAGERIFSGLGERKPVRLLDARVLGDGLAFLSYELAPAES